MNRNSNGLSIQIGLQMGLQMIYKSLRPVNMTDFNICYRNDISFQTLKRSTAAYQFVCWAVVTTVFLILVPIAAAASGKIEIVIGQAPISHPNAHEKALGDAFRNAIEKAVGVQVSSETLVKNAQVLVDEIYTYSEGFIERYEITNETTHAGLFQIEVKAWVQEGRLNKALFLNGLDVSKIYSWIGEPRVLILIQEYIDNELSPIQLTQTELENTFLEKEISIIDQEQLKSLKQRDRELAFNDPNLAVALGQRLGAEIVLSGKCISRFSREIAIGQFKMIFYSTNIQIRAYNTSNGEILLSTNYENDNKVDTSAMGKFDAATNSIKSTINSSKNDILFQIVRKWYDVFTKPASYQIIVKNIDYTQLVRLKTELYKLEGVQKIFERSFMNRLAQLEIRYEGFQGQLENAIVSSDLPYSISGKEQNRIILDPVK